MSKTSRLSKNPNTIKLLSLVAVVVIVAIGWLWWRNVQTSANNVFWGMLENNLSTASVTRHIVQTAETQSLDQYIRVQFGAVNAVDGTVTLKQAGDGGNNVVKSQTIGTPTVDFSRYLSIATPEKNAQGKPIDTSSVIGVWGKTVEPTGAKTSNSQYFQQNVMTLVPYGNFNTQQRQQLVDLMHNKSVYSYNISKTKSISQNGRPAYVYDVDVKASAYIELMLQYTKMLGLGDIGLDPSTYANSPPLKAEITVDKLSRQVLKISYPTTTQSETMTDQNLDQPINLPTKTIPIKELQDRVQKATQ